MARKVIAYFLLSVGILATLFFQGKGGKIVPYNTFLSWAAYIVSGMGLIMLFAIPPIKQIKEEKAFKRLIEYLKNNGERVTINLSDCLILENNYTCEHESRPLFEEIVFGDLERFVPGDDNVVRDKISNLRIDNITQSILALSAMSFEKIKLPSCFFLIHRN